jgi:hypothetical protein
MRKPRWQTLVMCGLAATGLLLAACSVIPQWQPSHTELPGERVEIPLVMASGDALVEADGKDGRYLIEIDTGCRDVTLMPAAGAELQAREHLVWPSTSTDAAGTQRFSWTAARVRELNLGGAKFRDFDADVLDFGHLFAGSTPPVRIIVGINLFHDCLLTLDLPQRRMVLSRGALSPANGRDIFDYRWGWVGNLEVPVEIGGKKLWAKLDTGQFNALSLGQDAAAGLSFDGAPTTSEYVSLLSASAQAKSCRLAGDLVFGQYRVERPTAEIGGRRDAVRIGMEILKDYRLTLDQKNRRVCLERRAAGRL